MLWILLPFLPSSRTAAAAAAAAATLEFLLSSEICRMADCCVDEAATLARLLSEVSSFLAATFCVYSFLVLGIIMSLMGKLKMASVLNHGKLLNRSSPPKYCTNMLAVVSPNPRGFSLFFSMDFWNIYGYCLAFSFLASALWIWWRRFSWMPQPVSVTLVLRKMVSLLCKMVTEIIMQLPTSLNLTALLTSWKRTSS